MENEIEGDWKDYTIRHVQLNDIPAILEFISEYFIDEPMRQLAPADDTYSEYSAKRTAKLMESEEVCGLSLIATHKVTGEIAGVHLQFIWKKEAAFNPPTNPDETIPPFRKILNILHAELNETKLGIFTKNNVDEVVWNFLVTVHPAHRNKGLSSELYTRSAVLLKNKNLPVAFSIFTSPFSRRCAQKVGFVEIDRVMFNELRNELGEVIFPNGGNDDLASVMVLRL